MRLVKIAGNDTFAVYARDLTDQRERLIGVWNLDGILCGCFPLETLE